MSLERLLENRIIQKITPNRELAEKTFRLAKRDLLVSKNIFDDGNYDWCLAIAYNAMLQAGRTLMFLKGYKPASEHKHIAVVEFVRESHSTEVSKRMVDIFDRVRKKRHQIVYDESDIVSEKESEQVLYWASDFVKRIEALLKKK